MTTFFARGLLDFRMALNIGGAILRIQFSDGRMGTNGVIPARYTTDNAVIEKLIEESPQYKSGRIFKMATPKNERKNK